MSDAVLQMHVKLLQVKEELREALAGVAERR